jgi:hypothetical protein
VTRWISTPAHRARPEGTRASIAAVDPRARAAARQDAAARPVARRDAVALPVVRRDAVALGWQDAAARPAA